MSSKTNIEWTDATWNPIRGCSRVSEGCRHCYAESVAHRFSGAGLPYEGLVQFDSDGKSTGKWNGQIKFVEDHLLDPMKWKAPRRIFVNSMSDLFHENVTDEMLDRIFAVMALCQQHTFQILTKRPKRMLEYLNQVSEERDMRRWINVSVEIMLDAGKPGEPDEMISDAGWPLPNVWLGVSVEDQKAADVRIPLLLQPPAAIRFLSAEPLLGPVDLHKALYIGPEGGHEYAYSTRQMLHWVIAGGESGPGARPMHPEWVRSLRDQCKAADVPFYFKQWGGWEAIVDRDRDDPDWRLDYAKYGRNPVFTGLNLAGGSGFHGARYHVFQRVGKKAAGALLDGREYREFPAVVR